MSSDLTKMLPAPADPMAVVRKLIEDREQDGCLTLRRWRGSWMEWHETHWVEIEETKVRAWLYGQLEHATYMTEPTGEKLPARRPWQPNRQRVSDVADALVSITHLPEEVDSPSWLEPLEPHEPRFKPNIARARELVACANGLLDVHTRELHNHTPAYFNRVSVPFDYDRAAPKAAKWLEFLGQLWPGDQASMNALQQWFGYVLSGKTDQHKMLLLVGPPRSGKGTIARVLQHLIGRGNYAAPTLASLGTNFGLSPLIGKPLAVVSDARLGKDSVNQVERLLTISGEDMVTIDVKYKQPWTGKLPTRFMILSNELPRFGDTSGAIANRFLVLQMTQSFLGREKRDLTEDLLGELPGILAWSLHGLEGLAEHGSFTRPKASDDAISALQDLVSPTSAFVRDCCEVGADKWVPVSALYSAWKTWAVDNGHQPGSIQTFGRDLRAVVAGVKVYRPHGEERRYVGIGWRTEDKPHNGEPRGSSGSARSERGSGENLCGSVVPHQRQRPAREPQSEPRAQAPDQREPLEPRTLPLQVAQQTCLCSRCHQAAGGGFSLIDGQCRSCHFSTREAS